MTTEEIRREIAHSNIRVFSDPGYLTPTAGDEHSYDRVYDMSGQYPPSSAHVIECQSEGATRNCVILASGGATYVHEGTLAALGDLALLVVGNRLVALRLPSLDVAWHVQVDESRCLGVHVHPRDRCAIVHGELNISRVDADGKLAWTYFGSDSFAGPCVVRGDSVDVTDASGAMYRLSVKTGQPASG